MTRRRSSLGRFPAIEFMESRRLLAADIVLDGGQRFYAVTPGPLAPGDVVALEIPPARLLVYPVESASRP